jgi:hypothetical protein
MLADQKRKSEQEGTEVTEIEEFEDSSGSLAFPFPLLSPVQSDPRKSA